MPLTAAEFLVMLDAATPDERDQIAKRIAPLVLNFPLDEWCEIAVGVNTSGDNAIFSELAGIITANTLEARP